MVTNIPGIGLVLTITGPDEIRHVVKIASIQSMGDTDCMQNECYITAAGRTHHCLKSLDAIIVAIRSAEADKIGY